MSPATAHNSENEACEGEPSSKRPRTSRPLSSGDVNDDNQESAKPPPIELAIGLLKELDRLEQRFQCFLQDYKPIKRTLTALIQDFKHEGYTEKGATESGECDVATQDAEVVEKPLQMAVDDME